MIKACWFFNLITLLSVPKLISNLLLNPNLIYRYTHKSSNNNEESCLVRVARKYLLKEGVLLCVIYLSNNLPEYCCEYII